MSNNGKINQIKKDLHLITERTANIPKNKSVFTEFYISRR